MKKADLISILKENKEVLKGKTLVVNNIKYSTLREFGNAILSESDDFRFSMTVETWGGHDLSRQGNYQSAFGLNFESVKVYADEILPFVFSMPSHNAIKQFGTNN